MPTSLACDAAATVLCTSDEPYAVEICMRRWFSRKFFSSLGETWRAVQSLGCAWRSSLIDRCITSHQDAVRLVNHFKSPVCVLDTRDPAPSDMYLNEFGYFNGTNLTASNVHRVHGHDIVACNWHSGNETYMLRMRIKVCPAHPTNAAARRPLLTPRQQEIDFPPGCKLKLCTALESMNISYNKRPAPGEDTHFFRDDATQGWAWAGHAANGVIYRSDDFRVFTVRLKITHTCTCRLPWWLDMDTGDTEYSEHGDACSASRTPCCGPSQPPACDSMLLCHDEMVCIGCGRVLVCPECSDCPTQEEVEEATRPRSNSV